MPAFQLRSTEWQVLVGGGVPFCGSHSRIEKPPEVLRRSRAGLALIFQVASFQKHTGNPEGNMAVDIEARGPGRLCSLIFQVAVES